mmetsp:Transcript_763/g.1940  ORF Transcript_763/g.1940 Transcript_763/m.1940 type:complete len:245 (-) Transcript_763:768-1502(-)
MVMVFMVMRLRPSRRRLRGSLDLPQAVGVEDVDLVMRRVHQEAAAQLLEAELDERDGLVLAEILVGALIEGAEDERRRGAVRARAHLLEGAVLVEPEQVGLGFVSPAVHAGHERRDPRALLQELLPRHVRHGARGRAVGRAKAGARADGHLQQLHLAVQVLHEVEAVRRVAADGHAFVRAAAHGVHLLLARLEQHQRPREAAVGAQHDVVPPLDAHERLRRRRHGHVHVHRRGDEREGQGQGQG